MSLLGVLLAASATFVGGDGLYGSTPSTLRAWAQPPRRRPLSPRECAFRKRVARRRAANKAARFARRTNRRW